MKEYPRTLAAVESAERSRWPIVDALLDEIGTTKQGHARHGEYERVTDYLKNKGYPSYSTRRVASFFDVGRWLDAPENARLARDFRAHPFERVLEAKKACKSDAEKALALLGTVRTKRDIRPDKITATQIIEAVQDLPDEAVERVEKAVADETVKRTIYSDRPKPKFQDAKRKVAAKQAKQLQENPDQAAGAVVASLGRGYAQIRMIVKGYQEFLALVEDEEWREYVRENLIAFQTEVNLALGEMLEGSLDTALARLLEEEQRKEVK